jgi:hypothetical protein
MGGTALPPALAHRIKRGTNECSRPTQATMITG